MEQQVKGIIVKLIDYKEADKLASIFSLEQGLITAKFTGVKRDKAKLKSVAMPFTFANFSLFEKKEHLTVTNADVIDNFPALLQDYNKTICGYIILDIIRTILPKQKPEQDIFLLTVSALKKLEQSNEYISTIDYILKFITLSGMGLKFAELNYVYLDTFTGNFCEERVEGAIQIDKKVYEILKDINDEKQVEINPTKLKQSLRLLHNILFVKFGEDVTSFQYL